MAEQASAKPVRRRPQSEVLTVRQGIWLFIGIGLAILFMAILYWNGFPVGNTIGPMLVGTMFIIGMGYTIKTGVLQWKGGDRTYRNEQPVAFWFWVSAFALVGFLLFSFGAIHLVLHFLR